MQSNLHLNFFFFFLRMQFYTEKATWSLTLSAIVTVTRSSIRRKLAAYLQHTYRGDFYKVSTEQSATHLSLLRLLTCVRILVCVCVLLSEPPWFPLSNNNNIPHHCPNHQQATESIPRDKGGAKSRDDEEKDKDRRGRNEGYRLLTNLWAAAVQTAIKKIKRKWLCLDQAGIII